MPAPNLTSADPRDASAILRERLLVLAFCAVLVALVWAVFGRTIAHEFVNYDDPSYIHEVPQVMQGLTWEGAVWAFTGVHSGNRHPLTTLSHMLDVELYGTAPRGHHVTNVLLHSAVAVLLFLVLRQMTGAFWRSGFAAAVWAVHPLRVESVAWIAERKDVLSGVFFLATLASYTWYSRRPTVLRYASVLVAFACALASKPTVVTLPFVLLLLDVWPLKREASWRQLIAEKVPLFLLTAAAAAATMLTQTATMSSLQRLPLLWRLENALVAAFTYVRQLFWPVELAVFYPHPRGEVAMPLLILAGVVVLGVTAAAVIERRARPYLAVGWLWFAGMLVPMIGVVQVGLQAHADRYTYLPHMGLLVALTWGAADLARRWRFDRRVLGGCAAVAVLLLGWWASEQAKHWKNSETLWRRTLAVTTNNVVAHTNLGNVLTGREAIAHYEAALRLDPRAPEVLNNLAWMLAASPDPQLRNGERAVQLANEAVQLTAGSDALYLRTLAAALAETRRFKDAIAAAQRALLVAEAAGNAALAFDLRQNIDGFRRGLPVRDGSLGEAPEQPRR